MKIKTHISSALTTCALTAWLVSAATAKDKFEAEAKVLRADAEKIARIKVPGGTIKEAELEKENGKLIWSFDITRRSSKDVTKVQVDAKTGEVLQVKVESVAGEWTETLAGPAVKFLSTGRNDYFILEPGYQLVFEGREGGKKTTLTITVLNETKKVGDVETRVIEEREVAGGKLAEVSRNYFACGADSKNIYYFGEDVDVYKRDGSAVHEGSWLAGSGDAMPGVLVPGRIKVGERYYQEKAPKIAMDRAELASTNALVRTPAGKFAHCLKVRETTPLEPGQEYKYYAPGIGLVQDGELKLVKYGFVNQ